MLNNTKEKQKSWQKLENINELQLLQIWLEDELILNFENEFVNFEDFILFELKNMKQEE
jgi:hypothetical protein